MDFTPDNYDFSDWRSSFEDHPQYTVLKCHVERAVQDLFLSALRSQHDEFIYIFDSEKKIEDFCARMIKYWELEEIYETCSEILVLRSEVIEKWKNIPVSKRGQEMVIREWLKSSF